MFTDKDKIKVKLEDRSNAAIKPSKLKFYQMKKKPNSEQKINFSYVFHSSLFS